MASSSFRDSMNSLGWSRRDADLPINTATDSTPILSKLRSWNPFGNEGQLRLPTHDGPGAPLPAATRREEEEGWFACKFMISSPSSATLGNGPHDWDQWCLRRPSWTSANASLSESMGSIIGVWCLQHRSLSLLRNLFHSFSCPVDEASKVCYLVSPPKSPSSQMIHQASCT